MKNFNNEQFNILKYLLPAGILFVLFLIVTSCDEDSFLHEKPLDFYAPDNTFVTFEDFEAANLRNYALYRWTYDRSQNSVVPQKAFGYTEIAYPHYRHAPAYDFSSMLLPTNDRYYETFWKPTYEIIYNANAIIERADHDIVKMNDIQKNRIKAEASFFRALCFKMLANLYGGVPLVLEEVKSPRRDFVRASRQEVYEQCARDLEFAVNYLPDIDEIEVSRINRLTAYHVLAEVYVSLERWQDAINAASIVIDHPGTALMTERFGRRANDPVWGGDVYWDLFQRGNQDRAIGNTESLWIIPHRFMTPGGGPGWWGTVFQSRLWQAKVQNSDGRWVSLVPLPNDNLYGRGGGMCKPSWYLLYGVWNKSGWDQDIRNSEYNIVRDFKVNNPASEYNGLWVIKDNLPLATTAFNDTIRDFWPAFAKLTTPGDFPKEIYHTDQTVPGSLTQEAQLTWKDNYRYRLAETYLLRAEAHLGNDDLVKAAEDINVVRRRAQAPEIDASMVDIDYILDERIRELHWEEIYLLTTARLDKTVERTRKYHPDTGKSYQDHHNLWPIPYGEIEKNLEATLEQNPGY
jgi:starch-binding outer membrane protein, SusD/RagB family